MSARPSPARLAGSPPSVHGLLAAALAALLAAACDSSDSKSEPVTAVDDADAAVAAPSDAAVAAVDAGTDAGTELPGADAGDVGSTCLSAPTPAFTGSASVEWQPPGNAKERNRATMVTWSLVSSVGCVDRYVPSGTLRWTFFGAEQCTKIWTPATASIASTDGALAVDRGTSPPTYAVYGSTVYTTVETCGEPDPDPSTIEAGGLWVDQTGSVVGGAIAGEAFVPDVGWEGSDIGHTHRWSFTATP